MDLQALNIFIQVAERKSFTKAGEKLGYSQPTISFQIKQLEQELDVKLFDRIGHTVSITDEGRHVLAYAQRICQLSEEMVAGTRQEPEGIVRIAMADSLCTPLIAAEFAAFRKKYPKVQLQIFTGETSELFRLLDHNEVDMVCTLDTPIYNTTYVRASEERIGVHFVVSAQTPLAQKPCVSLEELLSQPYLSTERGVSYNRIMNEQLAERGVELHPVLEMGSADLLCRLVENDLGVAFLPDYVTEEAVQNGTIVRLQVENLKIEVEKQILYRRDKWVTLQMKAIIEHLQNTNLRNSQ